MIVADESEHPAQRRRAGGVGMLEHIARPVDAGGLAIPDAEQAIESRAWKQAELLAAPDGGGAKVFVQTFPEFDVVRIQPFLRRTQLLVVSAQRRAAIAGDEAACCITCRAVQPLAIQRQADQRLDAGHIGLALDKIVFVVQRNFAVFHKRRILARAPVDYWAKRAKMLA